MATPNTRLKLIMDYFSVTGKELARAVNTDPSVVSRWIGGGRLLLAASPQMDAMAELFLGKSGRVADMEWLKAQFELAELPMELTSAYRIKQNLIMWLASDGESLMRNLNSVPPPSAPNAWKKREACGAGLMTAGVETGCISIALALSPLIDGIAPGGTIDVFLSSDRLETITNENIVALLRRASDERALSVRLAVCVSGDTESISKLLEAYIRPIISGRIELYIVYGVTQNVTNQMHVIAGEGAALVTETPEGGAPPVAAFVTDERFVGELKRSFDLSLRYAQPVLNVYGDEYTRSVIEILALEYCTPGALDVVKDSVNPMFMSRAAYDRFLRTRGHSEEEFAWRSAEFERFKGGMDANLARGAKFREIISLSRLRDIVQSGACRMAGLYFLERGYVDLDARGCLDIVEGYMEYIDTQPGFSVLILDGLPELCGNNCWHIKRDSHVSINNWQGAEPVMIHSDKLMLLREFQLRFDGLWAKGAGCVGSRQNVMSILREAAAQLEKRL